MNENKAVRIAPTLLIIIAPLFDQPSKEIMLPKMMDAL